MIGFARGSKPALGMAAMSDDKRTDLSHLPPSTPDEIRAMLAKTGVTLPEDLLQQFIAAWPAYEAMVRRIPRQRAYGEEPAHIYQPARIVKP